MTFGKFKDKEVSEVPADYLEFISRQDWFKKVRLTLRKAICAKLNIPLIERDNPYKRNFAATARQNGIMNSRLNKAIQNDDYNDSKNRIT